MAKNTDPGKPAHPDDQHAKPTHQPEAGPRDTAAEDAAFAELMEDALLLEEGANPPAPPSSSAVNLGRHPQEPHSTPGTPAGEPSFPWESLVQEPATPSEPSPAVFDSPSDVGVLRHAAPDVPPIAETLLFDDAALPPPESSRVDLADSGSPMEIAGRRGSDSDIFIAEAAADSDIGIESPAEIVSLDSAIDLGASDAEVIVEASAVDLGGKSPAHPGEDSSSVDLGVAGAALIDSASGIDLEGAVMIEDVASAIDLGDPASAVIVESAEVLPSSAAEILPEEDSRSDIFVGADVPPTEEPASYGTSGINLGEGIAPALGAEEGAGLSLEAAADAEGASRINLDEPLAAHQSSRDLIAEAVESGVDLGRAAGAASEPGDDVILAGSEAPAPGDSFVDLGAEVAFEDEDRIPAAAPVEEPDGDSQDRTREWQAPAVLGLAGAAAGAAALAHGKADSPAPPASKGAKATVGNKFLQDILEAQEEVTEGGQVVIITIDEEAEAERAGAAVVGRREAIEEPETAEQPEEEERPRKVPKPKYGRRWVGGTVVGALLASTACLGLWLYGFEPPKKWREALGTEQKQDGDGKANKKVSQAPPADLRQLVQNGDLAKEPPPINESDAADLAARGEYLWMQYLQKAKAPYKANDPAVVKALADLQKAAALGNADALLWQGHVYETLADYKKARAIYQGATVRFKDNREQKAIFEGALDRLEVKEAGTGGAATSRLPARLDAARLALLLIALQAPPPKGQPPKQPAGPATLPEAGFAFWTALKLARQHNYAAAEKALARAKKEHLARRLTRLRKAQNPRSDATEDIFLRACDELTAYWQLQDKLRSGGYLNLTDKKDPVKALEAALMDLKTARDQGATVKKDLETLKKEKKAADDKIVKLEEDLTKSRKDTKDALAMVAERDVKLKKAAVDLKAESEKLAAATLRGNQLNADKQSLEKTVVAVGERLKLKGLDPLAGKTALLKKLDDTIDVAATKDPMGRLHATMLEVRNLNATLTQRWTPETMLGYWFALLGDRRQQGLTAAAVRDVERVRANKSATAGARAQALGVEGLALRNRGEYARARTVLIEALKAAVVEKPGWHEGARRALKELTDPTAYYLPQAEALRQRGHNKQALAVLGEALKVFPENGRLLALRSLTRLDAALQAGRGKLTAEAVKEAQQDADAAIKAGATATGHYAAGRIAEGLGKRQAAVASYRKALAAAPVASVEAAEYRLALARVLLGAPAEAKRLSRVRLQSRMLARSASKGPSLRWRLGLVSVQELLLLTVVGLQPPPPEDAARAEAEKLADAVLARKDIDKLPLLKAQALAVKGLWTQALNSYVRGLQPHLSRELGAGLKDIVDNHPMQRRPDRLRTPHPMQAERLFAAGVSRYYARDYATAEKNFAEAISNFDRDARYHYFLGLARLQQRKRGSAEDFEQAAKLELDGRPSAAAVNASLERIQGRPRRLINEARNRVR